MSDFINDPQNSLVDELRRRYLEEDNIDTSQLSNEQIIFKHGQDLESAGYDMDGIAQQAGGLFKDQYYDIKNRPDPNRGLLNEAGAGLQRGISGELGMASAGLGLASGVTGLDGAEEYLMGKAGEFQDDAASNQATIERASDVRWDRPSEVIRFLSGAVGEVLPSMASSALSFGAGGLVGRQVAKQALKKSIDNRVDKSVADQVSDLSRELMAQAGRRGFATGAAVGGGMNSLGLGTGEIYSELYGYTKLGESHPDYVSPDDARRLSLGFGSLSGSLDFLSAGTLLSKLTGAPKEGASKYLKRLLYALPEGVLLEGTTEAAQQFVNLAASKYARGMEMEFSDNELAQLFDAGVLGAIGGSQFAAVGAIKGPKGTIEDTPIEEPGDQTKEPQKELLDYLQKVRGEDFRYQPGDRVDVALQGTGELVKVLGDKAQVKMDDGTLKTVPTTKLSAEVEVKEVPEEEDSNTKKQVTYDTPEDHAQKFEEVAPPVTPKPPEVKGDQEYTLSINGTERSVTGLTIEEKSDIQELYETLLGYSEKDMSKNVDYANKTGGFAPVRDALKSRMGESKYKRLWTSPNIQRLRDLGVLSYTNQWRLPTRLDSEYDLKVAEDEKEIRHRELRIRREWLKEGATVKIKRAGTTAEVAGFTEEGHVKLKGEDFENEEFLPSDLSRVANRPARKNSKKTKAKINPWVPTIKPPQGPYQKEDQEDTNEGFGNFFEKAQPVEGNTLEGQQVRFAYRTGQKTKKTQYSQPFEVNDVDSFTKSVRAWTDKQFKGKNTWRNLENIVGIEIGGKMYDMDVELDLIDGGDKKGDRKEIGYINAAGLEVDLGREDLNDKRGEIPFGITEIRIDDESIDIEGETLDSMLKDNSVPKDNEIIRGAEDTLKKARVAVVLKKQDLGPDGYPFESVRILPLLRGKGAGSVRIVKTYDPDLGRDVKSKKAFVPLKGAHLDGWEVVGKISSAKAFGQIDLFYDNMEELLLDPKITEALERAKQDTKKANEKFAQAKDANDTVDKEQAELDELNAQLKEEGFADYTEEELKQAGGKESKARVLAKARVKAVKARINELRKSVKKKNEDIDDATGRNSEEQKKLQGLQQRISFVEEQRKLHQEGKGDQAALSLEDIKDQEDDIRKQAEKLTGSKTTNKSDFIENLSEDSGGSVDQSNASVNTGSDDINRSGGQKFQQVDLSVNLAGRDLVYFNELSFTKFLSLVVNYPKMAKGIANLLEDYVEHKKNQEPYSEQFNSAMDRLLVDFYNLQAGQSIKQIQTKEGAISDLGEFLKQRAGTTGHIQYRNALLDHLETLDQGKGLKYFNKNTTNYLDKARNSLEKVNNPLLRTYDIIHATFEHLGVFGTKDVDEVYDAYMEYTKDPDLSAGTRPLESIIQEVAEIGNQDPDVFRETISEVYADESLMLDDLRTFLNKDYQPQVQGGLDDKETNLANRYSDPRGEARLNPSEPHIPNKISPTTGKVDNKQVLVLDEQTQEMSIQAARDDEQSYMAPKENPLEEYPDLLEQGRAAMNKIAPMGIGVEFGMTTALNNIAQLDVAQEIKNVALLLDNNILGGYKVEFMEWEQFRQYASPTKGVLNKAVAIPHKKKIYISTAFNNSYTRTADDLLAADIVHEALHAVSKPALDLGYAYANGKKAVIERMVEEHGVASKFNMDGEALGKIWSNINDTLLPYLRERSNLDNHYGLTSIDEFFSEVASNPKFQQFLSKQQLPQSLRAKGRGVLRTVLDFILSFLAKLGMKSASLNQDAMTYARTEMGKLIEISNGTSALHDSIESRNLRQINQLASRLDGDDILNSYDELLERFSRETPPESDGSVIKDISNVLKGSTRTEQETSERKREETEALEQYAKANGIEISRTSFEQGLDEGEVFGGEHEVYLDETQMRFFKANTHDTPATAFVSDYLDRLAIHNTLFPETAYRVEGIMTDTKTSPSGRSVKRSKVVVSQGAVIGEDPSQAQIDDHMANLGFTKLEGYDKPIYRKDDIDVWDVRPGNAAMVDGNLIIFDPRIDRVTQNELNQEKVARTISEDSVKQSMIEKLISDTTDIDELIGIMDEMDNGGGPILGNQFQSPSNDRVRPPNSRPDDNAKVMHQANAAGFSELVDELARVHRQVGEKLGLDLKEFLDRYGRPGNKSLSKIRTLLQKDMEQFGIDPDDVRIDDSGLNKVSRLYGVRKAIQNLERVREKARKSKQSSAYIVEDIENRKVSSKRLYEDLQQGKLPGRPELIKRVKKRLRNISFQKLEEYAQSLPNIGMSQQDLNTIRDLTDEDIGDIMDAVVEHNGKLEYSNKDDMLDRIVNSRDSRFGIIQGNPREQRVKRMAIAMAMRDSRDVLSLLRLSKSLVGPLDMGWKDRATDIANAKTIEDLEQIEIKYPGVAGSPLKYFIRFRKREIEDVELLEMEKAQLEVHNLIDRSLGDRSARLRMALGELEPVSIHDGVTLVTLEKDSKGNWKRGTFKVEIKNGKLADREGFIKANKDTLIGLRDERVQAQYGNEPWWEIMREQAELALAEPVLDEHFHAQRAAWFSGLQGLTERFSALGYEGKKLAQMGTRTVALYRDYAGKSMAYSKQFNTSAHKVMAKLGVGGNEFYSGYYQDIFWWMDNHPEYAGKEEEAFGQLWKYLKDNANVPDRTLLNEDTRRLTKDMINKAIQARDWEAEVNKRLGNRVRDDEIKVESFVNQEMVDFYRLPMEMGFATMPRTLNDAYLRQTYRVMEKNWGESGEDLLREASTVQTGEEMQKIYNSLFTEEVVDRFVKPYTNTDVRQSVFRGPEDEDGYKAEIGNTYIHKAFSLAQGDIYSMSEYLFENLAEDKSEEARLKWQHGFLKQWFSRFRQVSKVSKRVSKQKQGMNSGESMQNTPQSLDARMVESRLPKEFFYYNMYDEVSSNIRLALMTATASFGRNGDNANMARTEGVKSMEAEEAEFNDLMQIATKSNHDKPRAHYSRAVKREAFKMLRERGHEDAEKRWNQLYSKAIAVGEFRVVFDQLGKYYGKDNVAGPYQDANLLLEMLGAQSIQVLNNPKSSFWQALSLFEFPMAFRGLNKMAGKATTSALGNFVNQTFGGVGEAMGLHLDRAGTYAEYLNDTHYRMDEMDLGFKEYNSMLGSGGDLANSIKDRPSLGLKRYIRMANNLATHHRRLNKDGTRAPIDPLTPFTGIFPYVNNVVNHSIGVGAIHAYSDLVIKIANEIEARGLTDYQEFTAQDLGMGNKTGEWIIGEEDGFKRANDILVSSGAPSISRLAFDYADRKKNNDNAVPIEKNMALLINQLAMNNVAGEGFNSKPAWLYTSPGMRYFSTFLGWPLGKMGRDLQFIMRDSSDKVTTYKALLKYIGLLSAVYVPVGLSFAMLIDWYDEEMLEKPNNLPPISPWAALPILGLPLAMRDENFTIYSITSRLAKAGVPMGMGMDLVNGVFAKGDPYGAARELSLDSRIFAFSMFKNVYDAIGTWVHAGEFDWQLIGRPIAYGVGGNSVIQMMDLTSAIMDLDTEERRVADYIGMRNYIKKTAWMMGLPLRPPRKGGGTQTGVSINTRQMARAAYAGDTQSFLENYQEAVEAAREYLAEKGRGDEDPMKYVADAYKDRDLRFGITARRINDQDWDTLMSLLPPDVQVKMQTMMNNHEQFLRLIGGTRRTTSMESQQRSERARREAMMLMQ
jgi:hypothetical protein